ncbi:MAG: hypothetical protein AAB472_03885 [Patescibacteria group bacterium]
MTRFGFIALVAFGVLVACTQQKKVAENDAAQIAAKCVGWPTSIVQTSAPLQRTPRAEQAPYFNFTNSASVTVSVNGKCGPLAQTHFMSLTPLHSLPPHAITVVGDYTEGSPVYILFLMAEDKKGNRDFIGMKGVIGVNLKMPTQEQGRETVPTDSVPTT